MPISPGPGRFGAVLTAMVTPFDDRGELDLDGAARLARHLADNGSEGLVVTATTGEGPVLSDEETVLTWRAVIEAVNVPVIAGVGTNDTRHSIERARKAEDAGATAVMAVTPYYNRPSQAGIYAHFEAIARSVSLPVVLYDIPIRSGREIAHETMVRLASEVPNIVAVKDASGDPASSALTVADTPDHFELYSGDDKFTLPLLAIGAVGVISVESNWAGPEVTEMIASFFKGDMETARHLNAQLFESHRFQSTDLYPNPLPAKAMVRALGLPAGQCRLPMGTAPSELDEAARQVLRKLGRQLG